MEVKKVASEQIVDVFCRNCGQPFTFGRARFRFHASTMKQKKNGIVNIQEVGKFYIVDYADGTRIITGKEAAKEAARRRKKNKHRKK